MITNDSNTFWKLINSLSNKKALEFQCDDVNNSVIDGIRKAVLSVQQKTHANPIKASRPNEAGSQIKKKILEALKKINTFAATKAISHDGTLRNGYPDYLVYAHGRNYYIKTHTLSQDKLQQSFRTLYITETNNFKVTQNAYHLLISMRISRNDNFKIAGFVIYDLYHLTLRLKKEWSANNKKINDLKSICSSTERKGERKRQ